MPLSLQNSFASLHTKLFKVHVMSKSGDNIGLVWSKIYTSKQSQFEDVTIIPSSHAQGHPCLVSLLFMVSLYSTFVIRRIFIYLSPFLFFTAFISMVCNIFEYKPHKQKVAFSYRLREGSVTRLGWTRSS